VDPSTVRRRVQRLEEAGFISRVPRHGPDGQQLSNIYRFDGLIKEATPFALEALEARDKTRRENAERRTRKRPRFSLVDGEKKS
jgi:hypothetical protein